MLIFGIGMQALWQRRMVKNSSTLMCQSDKVIQLQIKLILPDTARIPHTLVKSPSTSFIALFSSLSACLAFSRELSATATAPLQFRPPQWRFPSSSRQPAPPQGLSAQGASPGAPQTCWYECKCNFTGMDIASICAGLKYSSNPQWIEPMSPTK